MKIKSIRSLGVQKTFSPEMESAQHNYITGNSNAVHKNSHAVSYCLVAHRCLWLKAHFAPEWWAAVMSDCHPLKLIRYMGIARAEKWEATDITYQGTYQPEERATSVVFDTINVHNLTTDFTATGDKVNQGMIGIKGIGEAAAGLFVGRGEFLDIDDFIEKKGAKSKVVMERFIKLGAFGTLEGHENSYATWMWYQYKYCSGKDITQLRKQVRQRLLDEDKWDEDAVEEERQRQTSEYKAQFPNRRKIPNKIQNWKPKPDDRRERVMALYADKLFSLEETLEFEKQYLGYYLHSPLDLYDIQGDCNIEAAKEVSKNGGDPKLEVVITDLQFAETKTKKEYARLIVSDGMQSALILLFSNELAMQAANSLVVGTGVQACVDYDEMRGTFTMKRNQILVKLLPKNWRERQREIDGLPLLDDA
jgi:DNA polymerase III alpha subunit